jgi:K+-sensing histidine kinase KdpD
VTECIKDPLAPPAHDPVALTGLYLLAIFPVAIGWGFLVAGVVGVASFVTFALFFAPPLHSFHVVESDTGALRFWPEAAWRPAWTRW